MNSDQNTKNSDFYRALEDKFRGSREVIKKRLQVYLPFLEALELINRDIQVLDLGCGRGEWLELLKENGYTAQGVDMDDGMLEACRQRGLNVQTGDAISFLKSIPDESLGVISGFHIAEHLQFDDLHTLMSESLRALKPAGLLILETPNPENISVATSEFFLDPTHQRPIPPKLLSFLADYYCYERVKILRLQDQLHNHNSKFSNLHAVLKYVSPDYAVIAQKNAEDELIRLTSSPFKVDYGTTLDQITVTYDKNTQKTEERVRVVELKVEQANANAQQALDMIQSIHNSFTWHITAPLRWCERQIKLVYQQGFLTRTKALVKKIIRPIVLRCVAFTQSRPGIHIRLINITKRIGLYQPLRSIYLHLIRLNNDDATIRVPSTLQHLTPKARRIYVELKTAVANNQNTEGK